MAFRQSPLEGLAVNLEFWKNKRVFLTGHTGFKGSWLSLWLQKLGAKVTGFALNPPTEPNLFDLANVASGMNSFLGDIRDTNALRDALNKASPEIIIHMAAQSLVRESYANPTDTYSVNVMGTVNLLEEMRSVKGIKALIVVTSDKCYENHEWLWSYRENEPMGGYDPYSSSKGCAELITAAYRSSFFNVNNYSHHGVAISSARAGNVIGGGDWAKDRLVPDLIKAFEQDHEMQIRNPSAVRPWQHVLEPLSGYLTLAEALCNFGPDFAEAWNFGPNENDSKTVSWVIETIAKYWGQEVKWKNYLETNFHEANYLKLDISKAKNRLGWNPRLDLEQSLAMVVDWSKKRLTGGNMYDFTLQQISNYQDLIKK